MKRNVTIVWSDNGGVILQIGCKTLVFADLATALNEIEKYARDPEGAYERYAQMFGWPLVPRANEVEPCEPGEAVRTRSSGVGYMGGLGGNR